VDDACRYDKEGALSAPGKRESGWAIMNSESRPLVLGLNDLLQAFWRYKLLMLVTAVATAAATYAVVSRMSPQYIAEGLLVIDNRQITIPELQTAITTPLGEPRVVQTELQVLRSRNLVEQVVLELGLHEHPLIIGEPSEPTLDWCDWLGVRSFLPVALCGEPPAPEPAAVAVDPLDTLEFAVDVVRSELQVFNEGQSYAIRVGYLSEDPGFAAQLVNTLMDTYITNQVIAKQETTTEANRWLTQRLAELERAMHEADRRVDGFRDERGLETADLLRQGGTLVDQRLVAVNRQLAEARTQLAEAEARHRRAVEMVRAGGAAAATSDLLTSPRIQSLSEHEAQLLRREAEMSVDFGPRHPQRLAVQAELADVRRNLSAEIDRAVRALESDVNVARARVRSIEQELAELEAQSGARAQDYARLAHLQREAEAARNLHQTFYERVQQTAAPGGVMQADARIVSRAVPPRVPVAPRVKVLTALGLLGGLLLGGAAALVLNRLDDRFRTLDDLAEVTGLTPLGAVPAVPAPGKRENALLDHLSAYPNSAASETIRSIRVAFKHATAKATKTLLVTSPLPNDGKTTFAVALGQIAARDGQKVLVIDCDLRKPSLSAAFDHITSHGLEDVLAQTVAWQDVIVRDEDSGLFCLPARGGSASPQQLLESYRFQTVLAEAGRAFDLVLVDSPPVMLVSDAIVLSKLVDAIVLVVSWKRTRRREATESLKRLQASGREVGVVLSRIRGRMPSYQVYGGYEYRA
jgi:polysaccharide biosynthesis transport protein